MTTSVDRCILVPMSTFTAELYRDADHHEVWRILDPQGEVYMSGIASDHDMLAILDQVTDVTVDPFSGPVS